MFVLFIPGPAVRRPFFPHDPDVDKARLCELLFVEKSRVQGGSVTAEALVHELGPLLQGRVVCEGAVIARCRVNDIMDLDGSARAEVTRQCKSRSLFCGNG